MIKSGVKPENEQSIIPDALNFDGIERRGNYRVLGCRQDLLHALDRRHVAAYVMTSLLRWTFAKREELILEVKRRAEQNLLPLSPEDLEIWIHMSYEEFAEEEFDGLFSHNTIKADILWLADKGLLQQRKNRNPRYKDYEYRVMIPALRRLLKSLPAVPKRKEKAKKQSPNLAVSPKLATPPNLAHVPPNLAHGSPKLAVHTAKTGEPLHSNYHGDSTGITTEEEEAMPVPTIATGNDALTSSSPPAEIDALVELLSVVERDIWQELESLYAEGKISDADYQSTRASLLRTPSQEQCMALFADQDGNGDKGEAPPQPSSGSEGEPDELPIAIGTTLGEAEARSPSEQKGGGASQSPPIAGRSSTAVARQENTTSEPTGQSPDEPEGLPGTPPASSSSPPLVHKTNKNGNNKKNAGDDARSRQSGDHPGGESEEKAVDDITKKRVEQVYSWLDECMREATGKPNLSYARTETYTAAIVGHALPCNPSREDARLTWFDMWNQQDKDGKYWYRGRNKLTPASWARQHSARLLSITAEQHAPPPAPANAVAGSSSGSGRRDLSAEMRERRKLYASAPAGAKGGA